MKRARQRKLKPRNPMATAPILKKGGAHKRRDKRADRAKLGARLKAQLREEQS
jgi:hypothetical protein